MRTNLYDPNSFQVCRTVTEQDCQTSYAQDCSAQEEEVCEPVVEQRCQQVKNKTRLQLILILKQSPKLLSLSQIISPQKVDILFYSLIFFQISETECTTTEEEECYTKYEEKCEPAYKVKKL